MSVTDPLLKDLKVCTLNFLEEVQHSQYVSECSQYLPQFCLNIEKIFCNGLLATTSSLGFVRRIEPFTLLEKISTSKNDLINYSYRNCIDCVTQHKNVLTKLGKLRLLIRYCLVNKCMHIPVEFMVVTKPKNIYAQTSILGDEILTEIFLSVLRQCSKITYKLEVKNASFLDYSWKIPELHTLEIVPTETLGISVSFAGEKAIIVTVKSNSILNELGKVQVGDVLDNLNGVHISSSTKGRLTSILKLNKLQPIKVSIIKAVYSDSKQLYPPLVSLLRQVHVDPDAIRNKCFDTNKEGKSPNKQRTSAGHKATYVGWVEMGNKGDAKQINKAAMLLVSPYQKDTVPIASKHRRVNKEILFEIGELGVKVLDETSLDLLLKHSYMEISSCGSVSFLHNYFAYVAMDENNPGNKFVSFIFQGRNSDVCYTILQSIGQGFQRTHFAV